ncbi:arylamine N-acetyltransferase [Bosea caraganae]|uniref:Arylamine N-acetyltransferase n=1 Tax=Bosea caraganae TaxID=2763117 RepID=A0A370LCH8_9HYPH|nr:arylamine N-acetyltransferase [Bosea caraganae]RDJ27654.1 arylamine N-acetyltransferase [Bosea caraganae]RDJ29667.1 arylamine N-acetyltransferase [Bosea caraganae]
MLSQSDLAAYLARIGYDGPVAPTRAALAALQLLHVQAIPFENFDSLSGSSPKLDLAALVEKLVRSRRGGYCFEQNHLFKAALEAFGFTSVPLIGRVLLNGPEDAQTPRSHMLLRLSCEGEDLVCDVGFGGQVVTGPLRLAPGLEQETPHEPYKLEQAGEFWSLRALVAGEWRLLYRFTLDPVWPIDYQVANHYVSTYPDSGFVTGLRVARILPRGRLALLNRRLTEHRLSEPSTAREIEGDAALRKLLAERFGIEVSDAVWRASLSRIPA